MPPPTLLVIDVQRGHARRGFDAETMHETALASLDGEFAQIMSTADAIERLRHG